MKTIRDFCKTKNHDPNGNPLDKRNKDGVHDCSDAELKIWRKI